MPNLVLKLIVTPALIGAATLAGRRWGPAVGGWLVGFFGLTLAVFAHRREGPGSAVAVLRGLLHGLFAPAAFFFVLGGLLLPAGVPLAFAAATAAALAAQGLTLWALRSGGAEG